MLIQLSMFQFELNVSKDNAKFSRDVRYLCFEPLSLVIILALSHTHFVRVLHLHISSNTIYGHVFFLFFSREFSMRETPTLTIRQHHLEIHIGEVQFVSIS